jgi:hypothetical protein
MSHQTHEFVLAYELIVQATDQLEPLLHPDDLEAGIVAVLATALEIASQRPLKELHEIYAAKPV